MTTAEIKRSEVYFGAFQWHGVAKQQATEQGSKYFAKGYQYKNLVYLTETGKRVCKVSDLIDDREADVAYIPVPFEAQQAQESEHDDGK